MQVMTKLNQSKVYTVDTHIFRHTCTHIACIKCIHTTHSSHIRWQHHCVSWSPDLQLVILNMQEHDGYMCEDVYFRRPWAFQSANEWKQWQYFEQSVQYQSAVLWWWLGSHTKRWHHFLVELKRREFVDDHFYQGTKEPCWGFRCIPYCETPQRTSEMFVPTEGLDDQRVHATYMVDWGLSNNSEWSHKVFLTYNLFKGKKGA